jgi:hypothetical protein
MERALLLLSSTSTRQNEEKIAGLALMNQILHQIIQKYLNCEQENEKKAIAVDFILEKVYERITVSFITSLLGSSKFPEIQKISLEFLSFHLFSIKYLSWYLSSLNQLFIFYFNSLTSSGSSVSASPSNSNEFSQQLYMFIYHVLICLKDEKQMIDLIKQLLSPASLAAPSSSSSGPTSSFPPSVAVLQVLNDLLYCLSTIYFRKEIILPKRLHLAEESSKVLISLFIQGLYGSAPEGIHDETLYYCFDWIKHQKILSPHWLLSSIVTSKEKQKSLKEQQSCFLLFLLSVLFNDFHLNEEELLCAFQDLHTPSSSESSSSSSEIERKRLFARYYRCFHSFLNCLNLLECLVAQVIPFFFEEGDEVETESKMTNYPSPSTSLSSQELLEMKSTFSRINKEILSFINDSCESMIAVYQLKKKQQRKEVKSAEEEAEEDQNEEVRRQLTALQRILLSKSISYLRLYYNEDPHLSSEEGQEKEGIKEDTLFQAIKSLQSISCLSCYPFSVKSSLEVKTPHRTDLVITVSLPPPSYHIAKGESTSSVSSASSSSTSEIQSVDCSFIILLFVADILNNHIDDEEENSPEEKERSFVVIDKIVDILPMLLDQTMKLMQFHERNSLTDDDSLKELTEQSIVAGLSIIKRIILLKIVDLQYLLRIEGGKTAFNNLINCQQHQINDLYYLLKGIIKNGKRANEKRTKEVEKVEDQDYEELVKKLFSLLDSLVLEDSFSETVESL